MISRLVSAFSLRAPKRGSLGSKAMSAGGWSVLQILSMHAFRLISNLIMTRILAPEAFGLMAMVGMVMTIFALLTDIGLTQSLMREPDGDQPRFLRVAWTMKFIKGSLVALCVLMAAGLLWLLAPVLPDGTIYSDPRLPGLVALAALSPLITGFDSTLVILCQRQMTLWRVSVFGLAAQLISLASMVAFAQISPTVWALLAGMLMANIFNLLASHLFYPGPRMKPMWDWEIVWRIWGFGKWLLGSSMFTFFATNADKLILASLLSPTVLGLYVIAQIWLEAGRQIVNRLSGQVGFPAMSEVIHKRRAELPRLFRRFQSVIDILCLLGFALSVLFGQWFIQLLYTPQYHSAGSYVQVLSLVMLVTRFDPMTRLLMNTGNSRGLMYVSAVRALSICVLLPIGYWAGGMEGALYASALAPLAGVPMVLIWMRPILGARQLRIDWLWLAGILACAAVMALTIDLPAAATGPA